YFVRSLRIWVFNLDSVCSRLCFRIYRETLSRFRAPRHRWHHRHGTPGHGRDHVLPALVPPHATLPVLAGELALGTWQSVCLVDTNVDNPRRRVRLSFLA
ncbi:YjbQ family protein, partial [Streptomyces albulus]|nr:YjbQ family protein [Streptomyces noursei]